ncbi:hypothetical protein [Paenibacillus agricola]|uniref:Uncharacterized protein n=1 Tax=Paenibacillus agricola TaxID=2716264 RepID=A0ABX0J005_9BACL|nr:hypothetical protein [Paenibacillus agricola]NHN29564.1 hypothetical protein [Paenibacillus agricola]
MVQKEKLFCLFEGLNERDQKAAYEFIQSLAHHSAEGQKIELYGKNYFVVHD